MTIDQRLCIVILRPPDLPIDPSLTSAVGINPESIFHVETAVDQQLNAAIRIVNKLSVMSVLGCETWTVKMQ